MRRIVPFLCVPVLASGLFWQFPLFRIVPLDELERGQYETAFNAADFTASFWSERLMPSLDQAADAAVVLKALRETPDAARDKFGRKVGVSRARLFLLRGSGTIVSVDKKGVGVSLDHNGSEPDVVLHTGLVFGNLARDATGLLDASHFSQSQDFNDISTALNRVIEERVIPVLTAQSKIGRRIQFVGCAQVPDGATDPRPLMIIPLEVHVEQPQ